MACHYSRCEHERVAVILTPDARAAYPLCEEHARRAERIHSGEVLWLGVGC
ncbi:MAG: hypothetical protein M3Q30_08025 [Actinomycetota bacterium]|nr:hypothetical protein [Actinomycetota bacterium]